MRQKILILMLLLASLVITGIVGAQGGNQQGGWIGIALDLRDGQVVVTDVRAGSPGDEAGIQVDDVILSLDGEAVESVRMLRQTLRDYEVGDTVTLEIQRGSETLEVDVVLGASEPVTPNMPGGMVIPGERGGQGLAVALLGVVTEASDEGWVVRQLLPFADADLQEGDVITAINGTPVDDLETRALVELLRQEEPLNVTVLRDGEEIDLEVTVERGNVFVGPDDEMFFPPNNRVLLGVQFRMLDEEVATELGIETNTGAYIVEVLPDTPAEDAGLLPGDIVIAVDGQTVDADHQLPDLIADKAGETVTLTILRDEEEQDIDVTLSSEEAMFFDREGEMLPFPQIGGIDPLELNQLLESLGVNLAEDGNVALTCNDSDGNPVFSLELTVDENGNLSTNFVVPSGAVISGDLDVYALDCTVDSEASPDATPESSGSGA